MENSMKMMEYIKQVCCFRSHIKEEATQVVHPPPVVTKETNAAATIQAAEAIELSPMHHHQQQQQQQNQQPSRPSEEVAKNSNVAVPNMEVKKSPRKRGTGGNLRPPTVKRSNQAPVTIQGWLWKQGSDGFMRWKKRWFVLADFCLFYYKGPEEDKILGSILLPSYRISPCTNEGRVMRKFAFKAEHQNMRTYYFAADTKEAAQQWMNAMSLATILQRDATCRILYCRVGDRRGDPSHMTDSHNTSTANEDEDSGFTSYHSRRYLNSPQHDGNSTLNGSFASEPGRNRLDDTYRDTGSDTSHPPINERLVDGGYLGSADKYPTSYGGGPHPHFYRNPSGNNAGGRSAPGAFSNAPPKPKRMGNQEQYGSPRAGGGEPQVPTEHGQYIEGHPVEYPDYREEYPQYMGHPTDEMGIYVNPQGNQVRKDGTFQGMPQEWVPQYEVYPDEAYRNYPPHAAMHMQQPQQAYQGRNDHSRENMEDLQQEVYRDEYDPAVLREKGQRLFLAQRPHSANFLEYDYDPENEYEPSAMVVRRPRSAKGNAVNPRPKSSIEQYDPHEYWADPHGPVDYPHPHQVPHTPHTHPSPQTWDAANATHNMSFESYSSSQGELSRSPRGHDNEGYYGNGKLPARPPTVTGQPQQMMQPRDPQFMRSASARLPSTHDAMGLPPYSHDDGSAMDHDPKRLQQREESMKRLLEWKQRMLQSPLSKKHSPKMQPSSGQPNNVPPPPPGKKPASEEYRKQVLQELASHEAINMQNQGPHLTPHQEKAMNQMRAAEMQQLQQQQSVNGQQAKRDAKGMMAQQQQERSMQSNSPNSGNMRQPDQKENKHMHNSVNRYRNSYSSDDEDENVRERNKRTRRPAQAGKARTSGHKRPSGTRGPTTSPSADPDYVNISALSESLQKELADNAKHEYVNFPLRRSMREDNIKAQSQSSDDSPKQELDTSDQYQQQHSLQPSAARGWDPDEVHSDGDIEHYMDDDVNNDWLWKEHSYRELHQTKDSGNKNELYYSSEAILDKNDRVYHSMRNMQRPSDGFADRDSRKYQSMRDVERNKQERNKQDVATAQRGVHKSTSANELSDVSQRWHVNQEMTTPEPQQKEFKDESVQTSFPYIDPTPFSDKEDRAPRGNHSRLKASDWSFYDQRPPSSYDDNSVGKYSDSGYDTLRCDGQGIMTKHASSFQTKLQHKSEDILLHGNSETEHQPEVKALICTEKEIEGPKVAFNVFYTKSSEHDYLNRSFDSDRPASPPIRWSRSMSHSALYEKHIQQKQASNLNKNLVPESRSQSASSNENKNQINQISSCSTTDLPKRESELTQTSARHAMQPTNVVPIKTINESSRYKNEKLVEAFFDASKNIGTKKDSGKFHIDAAMFKAPTTIESVPETTKLYYENTDKKKVVSKPVLLKEKLSTEYKHTKFSTKDQETSMSFKGEENPKEREKSGNREDISLKDVSPSSKHDTSEKHKSRELPFSSNLESQPSSCSKHRIACDKTDKIFIERIPYTNIVNESGFLQERPKSLTEKFDKFRKQKEVPPKNIVSDRIKIFEAASGEPILKNELGISVQSKKVGNVREQLQGLSYDTIYLMAERLLEQEAQNCFYETLPQDYTDEDYKAGFSRRRFYSDTEAILSGSVISTDESGADDENSRSQKTHVEKTHVRKKASPVSEVIITTGALRLSLSDNPEFSDALDSSSLDQSTSTMMTEVDNSTTALNLSSRRLRTLSQESPFYVNLHSTPKGSAEQEAEEYYIPMGKPNGSGSKSWLFEKGVQHLEKEEALYVQMDDQGFLSRSTDSKSSDSRSAASSASKKTLSSSVLVSSSNEYSVVESAHPEIILGYDTPYKMEDYEPIYAELKHELFNSIRQSESEGSASKQCKDNSESERNSCRMQASGDRGPLPETPSPPYEEVPEFKKYSMTYENLVPDLLAHDERKEIETASSASDADDESSKDFNHPRFSMSDSFRPASYYLKSKVFQGLERRPDTSDEDLESPPPIPLSPPPLEELEQDQYLYTKPGKWSNSEDEGHTYFTSDDVMINTDRKKASPRPPKSRDSLSPLQSHLNYSYYRVYEDDRRYTELTVKPLESDTSPPPEAAKKPTSSVQRTVVNEDENVAENSQTFPKALWDKSRSGLSRSSESTSGSELHGYAHSENRNKSDKSFSEGSGGNQVESDGDVDQASGTDTCARDNFQDKPNNDSVSPSPTSAAPYYYSDLLKDDESVDGFASSLPPSERSLHQSPRGRHMLNNSRAISPNAAKRDDIGRKVNKIQSSSPTATNESRSNVSTANVFQDYVPTQQQVSEELTHSIEYLEAKKLTDMAKNVYDSDTLRARRHQPMASCAADSRNVYPLGLRDKSHQELSSLNFAPPRQRRSRSLEGLLDRSIDWDQTARHFLDDTSATLAAPTSMEDFVRTSGMSIVGTSSREIEDSNHMSSIGHHNQQQSPPISFLEQSGGSGSGSGATGSRHRPEWDRERWAMDGRRVSRSLDELDDQIHFLGRGSGACGYERDRYGSDFTIDREKLRQWDMSSSAPLLNEDGTFGPNDNQDSLCPDDKPDFWEEKRLSKCSENDSTADRRGAAPFSPDQHHFLVRGPKDTELEQSDLSRRGHFLGKRERSDFDGGGGDSSLGLTEMIGDRQCDDEESLHTDDKACTTECSSGFSEDVNDGGCDADCSVSTNSDSLLSDDYPDCVPDQVSSMVAINSMYTEHSETEMESHDEQPATNQERTTVAVPTTANDNEDHVAIEPANQTESGSGSLKGIFISRTQPRRRSNKNDYMRDEPNMSDSELQLRGKMQTMKLRKFPSESLVDNSVQLSISAGDLLGKTHEELILLLIQLRRTQAKLQKAIDTCRIELEGEKKLLQIDTKNREMHSKKIEELTRQLEEYAKQFELSKPMVNLVDNMVKLGSLYGGSAQVLSSQYHLDLLTPEQYAPPKKMIEFSRRLQEQRLLNEERLEWSQLVPDQVDLQGKLQHLYHLDRSLQEESVNLSNLHQEKDMLERALTGIQVKAQESHDNAVEQERLQKQQRLVERELGGVQMRLVQTTKKLEETAAENAHIEHEILLLRQKIQQTLKKASTAVPAVTAEDVETAQLKVQLEEELNHVQHIMDDLAKRRQEIGGAVELLKDGGKYIHELVRPSPTGVAGSAPIPGRKSHRSTCLETDLDTMMTRDVLDYSSEDGSPIPSHLPHAHQRLMSHVPHCVNTDVLSGKPNGVHALSGVSELSSDYPPPPAPSEDHNYFDPQDLYGQQDISYADDRMKRFYGIIPREKPAEIKTVRIVKRESERRNKGKDRKKVTYDEQLLTKVIEEPDALLFDDFEYLDEFQITDFQRSMSLPRNYGRDTYLPAMMQGGIPIMPPNSLPLTTTTAAATTAVMTTTITTTKVLPGVPYYYRTPNLSSTTTTPTAHERLFGSSTVPLSSGPDSPSSANPLATPVFKSEAARQIVAETAQQLMASLTSDNHPGMSLSLDGSGGDTGSLKRRYKRRHYTISSSQPLIMEAVTPKLVHSRSRDDLDMERCLRSANTPDVVKSTIRKSENFDEETIDRELGLPQKILIPERYVEQEEEEEMTAEEKQHRLQKAESIKKMLSESTTYGDMSENDMSNASETLKKKYEQEKKQRVELLSLNQLLAQEVKERSKAVAAHTPSSRTIPSSPQ